MANKV